MSRAARLLELLVRVQTRPRFTAGELAAVFGITSTGVELAFAEAGLHPVEKFVVLEEAVESTGFIQG